MSLQSRTFSSLRATRSRSEEPFAGALGKTKLETVHWSLPTGEIAAVRVHTQVNATTDPALMERFLAGDLNWVQPAGSDELQQVLLPLVFHDEDRRIFALVLPEAYRSRELEERAHLLERLARDGGQPVPAYVVQFAVVFGEGGLSALLAGPVPEDAEALGDAELACREEEIVNREARLAEWEARLGEEQARLALDLKQRQLLDEDANTVLAAEMRRREVDIGRREAELREVERLVLERQAELDQREAHLQRQPLPAPGETESITRVAHRESLELAARQSEDASEEAELLAGPVARPVDAAGLVAWSPDDELREAQRELQARLGSSFPVGAPEAGAPEELHTPVEAAGEPELVEEVLSGDSPGTTPLEGELGEPGGLFSGASEDAGGAAEARESESRGEEPAFDPDVAFPAYPDPWAEARESDTGTFRAEPQGFDAASLKRSQQTVATPLDAALLEAIGDEARGRQPPKEDARAASGLEEEPDSSGDLATEEPALPAELSDWYEDAVRGPRWFLNEQGAHLAMCLPASDAESFVGLEPLGLVQLHLFPSFAWITIAVVAGGDDATGTVIHWPLDVRDDRARALLDRLAVDFRFALEIFDDLLEPVTTQELHFPLEENVRVVRERAQQWLTRIPAPELDPVAAWAAFEAPGYSRLATGGSELDPGAYQQLSSARQVAEAVEVVARWSTSAKEDELLLLRSFPAAAWRSLRLRVLRAAIEYGIWMDGDLRRLALDAGYATSKRDLLRACLSGFERVCVGELKGGLDPGRTHENWKALLEESERLGVAVEPRWEQLAEESLARATVADGRESEGAQEGLVYTDQLERLEEADLVEPDALGEATSAPVLAAPGQAEPLARVGDEREPVSPRSPDFAEFTEPGADELGELSTQELMVLLSDPGSRLAAALEVCHRGDRRALPELFGLLGSLGPTELLRLTPLLVGFGADAVPHFGEMLRSSSSVLRILSALALGALGAEETLDGLIDLLLDEPTEQWRGVALALGDFGRPSMMSLASRIRHSSEEQRTRIAAALAEVSLREGCRELLMDLSGSRDDEAAMLAVDALRQAAVLREAREGSESPPRDQAVALFTGRLLAVLGRPERDLDEDDIIEADDIVEEGDEVSDELLPEEPNP